MRKHRPPDQWQVLVDQQRASGLSAPQFCTQERIGYASFCNWRKRLSGRSTADSGGSPGRPTKTYQASAFDIPF